MNKGIINLFPNRTIIHYFVLLTIIYASLEIIYASLEGMIKNFKIIIKWKFKNISTKELMYFKLILRAKNGRLNSKRLHF